MKDYKIQNPILVGAYENWGKSKWLSKHRAVLLILDLLISRKQITDDMAQDFILGYQLLPKSILGNDEVLKEQISVLMEPVTDKIRDYARDELSPLFTQKFIHTGEGLDRLIVDGHEISITPLKIEQYARSINEFPLTYNAVMNVKKEFINQQKHLAGKGELSDGLKTKWSSDQLALLFDGMLKLGAFKPSQKQRFIDMCHGKLLSEENLLKWHTDKSLIRYFMLRLTSRDIKPKEISRYIYPKISSNDKHTGTKYLPIKILFDKIETVN